MRITRRRVRLASSRRTARWHRPGPMARVARGRRMSSVLGPATPGRIASSSMTYEVKTRVFEGPLDLLLQLITARQVEITELSISDLVSEYLEYLDVMSEMDLTVTSEFLLIASTLIQLKARRLLPDGREIDFDDELALAEERDRLLSRLLMNLTFKDVAAVLSHRFAAGERYFPRRVGPVSYTHLTLPT